MEFNKPVSNPMMVGSIELLKAEDTPEHRQMFLEELQKAKFLELLQEHLLCVPVYLLF